VESRAAEWSIRIWLISGVARSVQVTADAPTSDLSRGDSVESVHQSTNIACAEDGTSRADQDPSRAFPVTASMPAVTERAGLGWPDGDDSVVAGEGASPSGVLVCAYQS
jgi:hypothetical protein